MRAVILAHIFVSMNVSEASSRLRSRSSLEDKQPLEGTESVPKRTSMKELDPFDCYKGKGEDYVGLVNLGESGRNCMNWLDQGKYKSTTKGIGGHNYCRNPNGDKERPWCYTVDPDQKWEFCEVPKCKE